MKRISYLLPAFLFIACQLEPSFDLSPCKSAFDENRQVDSATATIPYMKTCGLSLSTALLKADAYSADIVIDQAYLDLIYEEFKFTIDLLDKNHIPYYIEGGTLLGAIRNGGLIPNDDDIDIAVEEKFEKKILGLKDECAEGGFELIESPFLGYKIKKQNTNSNGLDIFMVTLRATHGKDMMTYAREGAFSNLPNYGFPPSALDNLRKIPFGPLEVSSVGLTEALDYLDHTYGKDWYTTTYKIFDHVNKRAGRNVKTKLLPTEYYHLVPSKDFFQLHDDKTRL